MLPRRLTLLALLLSLVRGGADDASDRQFLDVVFPLLDSRCISCHGADKQKGGLRLDSREATLRGGETGPSVVPGKPEESLLLHAVTHRKKDLEMPPKERLTPKDIAVLEKWVLNGAPWPAIPKEGTSSSVGTAERIGDAWSDPRNPITKLFNGQRIDLWSLKPIACPTPPQPRNSRWVRNPIDAFILTRLEAAHLSPSREAARRSLLRRVTFDLTGLPPTPAETEAFLADPTPVAYEHLVDRLLASPRYGEHAARLWLDVIRYSDSNGFDWDEFRPQAWRFRDYVIRAFNSDKPFDQFVREQLAGDELLAGPPKDSEEQDQLLATGYLRLGPHDNSAGAFNEQDRSRAELLADLTETTGSAFLGLTLACCRCHDHKFDPLSQADHFRIRSFFEPVKFGDDLAIDLATTQQEINRRNEALELKVAPLRKEREDRIASVKKMIRQEKRASLTAGERELLALPKEKQTDPMKAAFEALRKRVEPSDAEVEARLSASEKERQAELTKQIDSLNHEKRKFTKGLLMTDTDGPVATTRILFQGDHKSPRGSVAPGFISALDPNPATLAKAENPRTTGRRLTLGSWITSPTNPLTARVFVNRIWQEHFGRGLVTTPNDFGLAGARPTHPELLDWLASEFVREGWSVKSLHRLIVMSATYRQASSEDSSDVTPPRDRIDAENQFYWRQNLRRLSAEQTRDALLATSGLLLERSGGPPVWPELPAEVLQANPAFLDDNAEKTKGWYPSAKTDQNVRSIYLVQKRTVHVPLLETFDQPENTTSCPRRNTSIVAPQALSLMNGPLSVESARAFAARAEREAGRGMQSSGGAGVDGRVCAAFRIALQRDPSAEEKDRCARFLETRNWNELCRVILNLNEFLFLD